MTTELNITKAENGWLIEKTTQKGFTRFIAISINDLLSILKKNFESIEKLKILLKEQ